MLLDIDTIHTHMTHSTAIVIGAGMAGLKATIDLTEAGIPVQVLEARDRLGGRLLSEKTASGHVIDIGASWFHDCLTNPLLEKYYKKQNKGRKIELAFDDSGIDYVNAEGQVDVITESLLETSHELETYLSAVVAELPPHEDISMRDACLQYLKLKAYTMTPTQIRLSHQLARLAELWVGTAWENVSAREICSGGHFGRNALVLNGYRTAYDGEMEELLSYTNKQSVDELLVPNDSGVQFHLDTEVFGIAKNYQTGRIEVSTKSKGMFSCDYIVVTTPLSILKLTDPKEIGCITWSPPLPKKIRGALDSADFSHLGKLFLEYNEQFWPDTDRFFVLADDDLAFQDAIFSNKPLTKELLSTQGIDLGKGQCPTPLVFINLTSVVKKKYGLPVDKPFLVCLTSEHMTKELEMNYRNGDMDAIVRLINPAVSRISNLPIAQLPKPTYIRMSEWSFDPYSRGSYSGLPIGNEVEYIEIINILTNPRDIFGELGTSRVRFAGEGIMHEGNGCVHAAWATGKREAKAIIDMVNKPKL